MAKPRTSLLQMSAPARVGIALVACVVIWAAVAAALA
jgi:hypothetical protein